MGFNNETLPENRAHFWGGRSIPFKGVTPLEWWPTQDEADLVESVIESSYRKSIEETFGQENAERICNEFDKERLFRWFTENFTRKRFTDDYKNTVSKSMIHAGFNDLNVSLITPWLLKNN